MIQRDTAHGHVCLETVHCRHLGVETVAFCSGQSFQVDDVAECDVKSGGIVESDQDGHAVEVLGEPFQLFDEFFRSILGAVEHYYGVVLFGQTGQDMEEFRESGIVHAHRFVLKFLYGESE